MKDSPKILVIGSAGRLGSEIMRTCVDQNPTGWDSADLDVTDEQAVWDKVTAFRPDLVYNCAAYNDVDKAEEDRASADNVNGYAVGYLAKSCKAAGAILVHYSSGMVFDGQNPEGYAEDDPPTPVNAYGRSKLAGELEAAENLEQLYVIRTSWLFGAPGSGASSKPSFIDLMLDKGQAGSVTAVADEIGCPTYTKDLAQASRALVEMGKPYDTYHITNTGAVSRLDWAREIFDIRKMKVDLKPVKSYDLARQAKRPHYEVLRNTRFIEMRPWTEALRDHLAG